MRSRERITFEMLDEKICFSQNSRFPIILSKFAHKQTRIFKLKYLKSLLINRLIKKLDARFTTSSKQFYQKNQVPRSSGSSTSFFLFAVRRHKSWKIGRRWRVPGTGRIWLVQRSRPRIPRRLPQGQVPPRRRQPE